MLQMLSDAPYVHIFILFYLRLFLRMHSDQTEFCVSYDFLIASSCAPIVKAPLRKKFHILQVFVCPCKLLGEIFTESEYAYYR